jgi:hypothetical protein
MSLVKHQGFAPQTMTEAIEFSNMLSRSQMVPKNYQNKPEDVLVAVQWGYEIGLAPLQALQNISVINGKPSVYGDAAMALVQASPVCEDVQESIEGDGTSNPVAICRVKRRGRSEVVSKYSVEDAKRAGLWGKQGPWTQYPKRMLQMRARGFALRDAFPDVLKGLITAEEAQDMPVDEVINKPIKIASNNPLDAIVSGPLLSISEPEVLDIPADKCLQNTTVEEMPVPPMEDAPLPVVSSELQKPGTFKLSIPGKEPLFAVSIDDWMESYNDMADKVARSKLSKEVKASKIGEFNTLNADVLGLLSAVQKAGMTAHKQKRKAMLDASS